MPVPIPHTQSIPWLVPSWFPCEPRGLPSPRQAKERLEEGCREETAKAGQEEIN